MRYLTHYRWLKDIIFVPGLCHKINNSYKNVVIKNPEINGIVTNIRNLANDCKEHKDDIGATCPSFISTRWIYDFDLTAFILNHSEIICQFAPIPEGIEEIFPILEIYKTLIRIFEDPSTPFMKGFVYIGTLPEKLFDPQWGSFYAKRKWNGK